MNKQYAIISQFNLCNGIVITIMLLYYAIYFMLYNYYAIILCYYAIITVMLTSYKTTINHNGGVAMVLALGM